MDKHQQVKIQQKLLLDTKAKETHNTKTELTFQPTKAATVPDFKLLQEKFKQNLERTKNSKLPTQPNPFDIKDMKEKPTEQVAKFKEEEIPGNNNNNSKSVRPKTIQKENKTAGSKIEPVVIKQTKKILQFVEQNQQAAKIRETKEKEKEEVLENKRKEMAIKASEFRKKYNLNDELSPEDKIHLLTQQKLDDRRQRENTYKNDLETLAKKLEERPSYMERITVVNLERKQFFEKVKTLINTHNTLSQNNPGFDARKIFSPEEIKLIEEGKLLEKQGKLKC
jgi:hypothetical protein